MADAINTRLQKIVSSVNLLVQRIEHMLGDPETTRSDLGFTDPVLDKGAPGAIGTDTPAAGRFTTVTATEQLLVPGGSANAPGVAFSPDTDGNTGFYFLAQNLFGVTAGGVTVGRFSSTGFAPGADNSQPLGSTSLRFSDLYLGGTLYLEIGRAHV